MQYRPGALSWVQQNYIRAETIARANARLVVDQAKIPLAQAWGGGEVASADGLRFVVPVRTLNAGPNPKYFNTGRRLLREGRQARAGLEHVASGDYAGEHWLTSFAVYLLTTWN